MNREENEAQVNQFLSRNPEFVLEGFYEDISYFPLDNEDKQLAAAGMLTIIPGKYGTDGMFYAKLRRKTSY
jgi:16S rRNA (cytosine967-C5)-methyltransferase